MDFDLHTLPFDQYGRYRIISEALDAARPLVGRRLRVLDVGGYFRTRRHVELLPARMFLPADDVTVVDRLDCALPGYVRGDGRHLEFTDGSFDFAVSCDTLEHVPPPDRAAFWQELLRVARCGVLLIAPFAGPEVEAAERLVLSFIRAELGQEQPQLAEHGAYGLPDLAAAGALLDGMGLRWRAFPSGDVHAWALMMLAKHARPIAYDDDLHEQLDSYYTRFLGAGDRREPAYRHLVAVERAGGWLDALDAALSASPEPAGERRWSDLVSWALHLLGLRRAEERERLIAAQAHTISALEREVAWRAGQAEDLRRRAEWLEAQLAETRRALQAVEQGRVMRLLRLVGRRGSS